MTSVNEQLIDAAKAGDLDLVLRLINKGADVNAVDDAGGAALHHAAAAGNADMVRLLLAKRANPDLSSDNMFLGFSAVDIACMNDYIDVLRVLRQHRADFTGKFNAGKSALHVAASWNRPMACAELLGMGLNINSRDKDGCTPLHAAATSTQTEALMFLIESGADINVQNDEGFTPLERAVSGGHHASVEILLQHGAQIPPRMLEDDYLDIICEDAAPEERAWVERGVRMVRAAVIGRDIDKAFSDDDESCSSPRASSTAPSL